MEYSLATLNQNSKLNDLQLKEIINILNLIGFEIDDIFYEKTTENKFIDNTRLLIKIPANREDLLNEAFFLNELSTILVFQLKNTWQVIKKNYNFILKQKYFSYYQYQKIAVETDSIEDILMFNIEIKNIQNILSPLWVQNKLTNIGVSPSKDITDFISLTNFEWGQNFNTYIGNSSNFILSVLTKSEAYLDQNNVSYILAPGTIIFKDKNNTLLTVLGTINKIKIDTNSRFFLQSIFSNSPLKIDNLVQTSLDKKISLRSFKKLFLDNFKYSFQRLLTLLEINSSIEISPIIFEIIPNSLELKRKKILKCKKITFQNTLNLKTLNLSIFEKIGLKLICETKTELYFSIPTSRKDLEREIDLIEEYSRFIGYKNFKEIFPTKSSQFLNINNTSYEFIKQFFLNLGFNEIISTSILDSKKQTLDSILLNNPLNNDFFHLRTNIVIKLLNIFENNLNLGFECKNFFEIGRTFKKKQNKIVETDKLAGIFQLERVKKSDFSNLEWFIAKGLLENFLSFFDYKDIEVKPNSFSLDIFHETKSIAFKVENQIIGIFGEINPSIEIVKLTKYPIYLFEFNLQFLKNWRLKKKIETYTDFSKYPSIIKDISFTINKNINFFSLKKKFIALSPLLKRIEFFDIYCGEKLTEKINIGVRLEFQSNFQTLTTEEIEDHINDIKKEINQEFNIVFR
jgi:phenylalanyl-tRNA synthetase beta chain